MHHLRSSTLPLLGQSRPLADGMAGVLLENMPASAATPSNSVSRAGRNCMAGTTAPSAMACSPSTEYRRNNEPNGVVTWEGGSVPGHCLKQNNSHMQCAGDV